VTLPAGAASWQSSVMFDEAALLEKSRKIEALHADVATEGERAATEGERAAAHAAQRITERLAETCTAESDVIRRYSTVARQSHRWLVR